MLFDEYICNVSIGLFIFIDFDINGMVVVGMVLCDVLVCMFSLNMVWYRLFVIV